MEDNPCFPCQQLGETTPGKFWCSDCEALFCQRCAKTHRAQPNSVDHDFCDVKYKDKVSRRKVRCKEHDDQLTELYCKSCNISHCYLCFVDQHRKCEDVVTVKSFVSDMKTELSELKHQLEEQQWKSNNIVEHQTARISILNSDKILVIDEIRCASQKAVDLIKKKEKQLVDQVEELTNRETNDLKSKVKQGNIQMQTYRQYSEFIKQAVSSYSEVEICEVYQVWKSGQLDIIQGGDEEMRGGNISSFSSDSEEEGCDVPKVWKTGQLDISQEGDEEMGGGNISSFSSDSEEEVCDVPQVWKSGQLDTSQEEDEAMEGGNISSFSSDSEEEVCDVPQVWKSGQLDTSQEEDEAMGGGNISSFSSDSEEEVCDVSQVWQSGQLDTSQEEDEAMGGGNISSVRFSQQKQNILEVLDSLHLGEIVTTYLPTDVLSSPLRESVDTRLDQDEEVPDICDVTVLEVESVHTTIVTDYNNKCVKSFYSRYNKTCNSRLQLDNGPCGITQLGDNKVMVAFPFSNKIITVAVTPDLVYETCVNTNKRYYSLALMTPSRLAAGGDDCVDILNMQGEVVKSVATHNNMELFECPRHMCISNTGHLLVSDIADETVTCLTSEGNTVWINFGSGQGELTQPTGIAATGDGDVLFADRNLGKVIQLSESGEYVRDVLTSQDGLRDPWGILVDKHGTLYICDSGDVLKFVFMRK